MKIEKVKKLSPLERFQYWITERESIRLKKEAGEPKPWTDDVILQSYRFCNVRRMDDKVSKWLLENWYEPNFSHLNMLRACTIARHFNRIETLKHLGFPRIWNPSRDVNRLREYRVKGNKLFSGAYMIRAAKQYPDKVDMVFNETLKQIPSLGSPGGLLYSNSMQLSVESLAELRNLGSFMAGQIVADLRWAVDGEWEDRMHWAPIGPGSKRGINRLYERDLTFSVNQSRFNDELPEVIEDCLKSIPRSLTNRLEAIDYQNCCCEFDKYERALWNEGKPKQKYPGV